MSLPERPNLSQTANLLDTFLQKIQEKQHEQDLIIRQLQIDLQERPTYEEVETIEARLLDRFDELNARVSSIERSIEVSGIQNELTTNTDKIETISTKTSPTSSPTTSIGYVVAQLTQQAQSLQQEIEQKATKSHVDQIQTDLQQCIDATVNKLQNQCASAASLEEVLEHQRDMSKEVSALQGVVSCKLDRSELRGVQSVLHSLQEHAKFRDNTEEFIKSSRNQLKELDASSIQQADELNSVQESLQEIHGRLSRRVDLTRFEDLSQTVDALSERIQACAVDSDVKSRLNQIQSSSQQGATQMQHLKQEVSNARSQLHDILHQLQNYALQDEIKTKVDSEEFKSMTQELTRQLNNKADLANHERLRQAVDRQGSAQIALSKKADIAVRFVEWYGKKGEAYEYNASAMERHMNALAVGNRARVRVPGPTTPAERDLAGLAAYPNLSNYHQYASTTTTNTSEPTTDHVISGTPGVRIGGTHVVNS